MKPSKAESLDLHRLTGDEALLLAHYRACCNEHKQTIRQYAAIASSRCADDLPAKVVSILKQK